MYVILTVPIVTPAAILIQFQLMRMITHSSRGYDQTDDDVDDDSDEDDADLIDAKPPPSPLCIEVVVSDSAESSPQRVTRELDKTITQRTSPQSPIEDDESAPLLASTSSVSSPAVGTGAMIMPNANGFETTAIDIVHFDDMPITLDDDDDVVGHSNSPPLTTSRLWLLWYAAAAGEWRFPPKHWFSALEHNTVICV